uniref:Uncharacterized protein n=1 Tax=viral metagenome TaxID=1070528 RepID=A0A6M3XVG4_9ZZZZ
MNRVCLTKDRKLIEMQSGGNDREDLMEIRLNTLKQNALNAGYKEDEIEVKWITDEEWTAIQEAERVRNYDPSIEVKAKLAEIDLKSIRAIREYLAAKPDAPAYLKTYEAQAIAERTIITK